MNGDHWIHVLVQLAIQHLWLGAVFAIPVLLLPKLRRRTSADACSWILAVVFALSVIAPFAIFLPGNGHATVVLPGPLVSQASPTRALAGDLQVAIHQAVMGNANTSGPGHLHSIGLFAIAIWLAGLAWMLCRLGRGWFAARRVRASSRHRPDLEQQFAPVLHGQAMLRVSECIAGPMVVGLIRPCVLLPRRLVDELTHSELTFALRHELAHIRRRDPLVSLVQALWLAVYWWSPPLRFIAARLDSMREMACDEQAARQSGNAVACADALLATAKKISISSRTDMLAVGMLRSRTTLTQRIEGLLQMNVGKCVPGKMVVAGCSMLVLSAVSLAVFATPRVGRIQAASADVSGATSTKVSDGAERLIEAAEAGHTDVIKRLVAQGADVNARIHGDGTALIVAAKRGDLDVVNTLLGLGADVNEASRGDGNPLIAAAARGHLAVAKRLVDAGADVNAKVKFDETPLINAARSGSLPVVKYLVERGADVNLGMVADRGRWRSPLNQASTKAIRQFLISKGAVPHK